MDDIPPAAESETFDSARPPAQKKTELNGADRVPTVAAPPATAPASPSAKPVAETAPPPLILHALPALNWDGNWPLLAAALPVRGVAQQLAQQSEMLKCDSNDGIQFHLRVAVETLLSAGSVDKLATALTEHFGKTVRVSTEIGTVQQTANAHAQADRAARQREAEQTMRSDPFVENLMREFGATIVPGSIKPVL